MRACPPPHLYGLPMIWLAAATIARTARGAPRGIAARPSVRRRAVVPDTVGVVASGGGGVTPGAGVIGAGVWTGCGAATIGAGVGKLTAGSGSPGNRMSPCDASQPPGPGFWADAGAAA